MGHRAKKESQVGWAIHTVYTCSNVCSIYIILYDNVDKVLYSYSAVLEISCTGAVLNMSI